MTGLKCYTWNGKKFLKCDKIKYKVTYKYIESLDSSTRVTIEHQHRSIAHETLVFPLKVGPAKSKKKQETGGIAGE